MGVKIRKDVKNPGIGTGGVNRLKAHCVHGHSLSDARLYRGSRECRVCHRIRAIKNKEKIKRRAFEGYGGKCAWPGCSITDIDILVLDHVGDDGKLDRVRGSSSGDAIYRKVIREGFPEKYQPLCANHNLKKEVLKRRRERLDS